MERRHRLRSYKKGRPTVVERSSERRLVVTDRKGDESVEGVANQHDNTVDSSVPMDVGKAEVVVSP